MSLLETICALWVVACTATVSIAAWGTAQLQIQATSYALTAKDCATDAAERWMAGAGYPSDSIINGQVCRVEVTRDENTHWVHISSLYAGAHYDLWIPAPPGGS